MAIAASGDDRARLTGGGGRQDAAAQLLPWLVPAAAAQVYAGLAASGMAAFGDYGTAALGFGLGAVAGLVVIVAFADHGVVAWGWGLAVNGAIALAVPLAVLAVRRGVGRPGGSVWPRLRDLAEGAALPFALQGLYLIALRFAAGEGAGAPTTFSYAYLIAALLVAVTATSLALVSSVPLTRDGLTPERTARHVVAASWLCLALVAAAAGVFALAGEPLAHRGARVGVLRRHGRRAGPARRLPGAVDGGLGRRLGDVPAAVRPRPGARAAAARTRRAPRAGAGRVGDARGVRPRRDRRPGWR